MKRREFVGKVGVGSAAAVAALTNGALANTAGTGGAVQPEAQHHDHRPISGTLSTATVSFGEWRTDVPLDRAPAQPPGPPAGNGHLVIPHQVTIKVGGTVNFIIAGFHQVVVYAPGKRPQDVNVAITRPTRGIPPGVPLINDAVRRLYAGPDPSTLHSAFEFPTNPLLDRVEAVQFSRRGRHLVICGVLPHFVEDNMYGWVRVIDNDNDD
jgi:hypothetical protein